MTNSQNKTNIDNDDQIVTPWDVSSKSGFDYLKLIEKFGCHPIDGQLIKKLEELTGVRAHPWLRRGLFFSQKDFAGILSSYEKGEQIYIYTGRGPTSEAMHLGHIIPFQFTKWLQDVLDCIVVIQLSDDEKFYFKDGELSYYNSLSRKNALDIIACGFNPDKTFIFSNLEFFGGALYETSAKIMKMTTGNQVRGIFGLDLDSNLGQLAWPAFQAAPAFYQSFPGLFKEETRCIVPMAIDQDPYFRMARDIAQKTRNKKKKQRYLKPATIHSQFLPALEGPNAKMSSSGSTTCIFLTDTLTQIKKKVNKHAHSGGRDTTERHRELGGNLEVDMAFQYLLYFYPDDKKLADIARKYTSGEMMSGEIKKIMIEAVTDVISRHQEERSKITDEIVNKFFNINRDFDHTVTKREPIELYPDEVYQTYGFNFDKEFGTTSHPSDAVLYAREAEEEARQDAEEDRQKALFLKQKKNAKEGFMTILLLSGFVVLFAWLLIQIFAI